MERLPALRRLIALGVTDEIHQILIQRPAGAGVGRDAFVDAEGHFDETRLHIQRNVPPRQHQFRRLACPAEGGSEGQVEGDISQTLSGQFRQQNALVVQRYVTLTLKTALDIPAGLTMS